MKETFEIERVEEFANVVIAQITADINEHNFAQLKTLVSFLLTGKYEPFDMFVAYMT